MSNENYMDLPDRGWKNSEQRIKRRNHVLHKRNHRELADRHSKENSRPLKLGSVFERCYTDTLDRTISQLEDGTTFVLTGDIPAMWLRDSTAQVKPY